MRRIVIVLAAAAAVLAAATSAGAAGAAAPKISFKEVEPGWYSIAATPAAPVKVTLRYGAECNFVRAECRKWKVVGVRVLPKGATGDASRISWLYASDWHMMGAVKDQLPQGFYEMYLVVPGKPASLISSRWRLASGD